MHLAGIFLVGLFGLLGTAVASDVVGEMRRLLAAGDSAAAYELGEQNRQHLGDAAFDLVFGIAATENGNAGEAVLALERYLLEYPDDEPARLELARAYFVLGDDTRAREEFRNALKLKPPPEVAAAIDRYLDALSERATLTGVVTRGFVEMGLAQDSNVNLGTNSRDVVLPLFGPVLVTPDGVKSRDDVFRFSGGGAIAGPLAPGVVGDFAASIDHAAPAHDTVYRKTTLHGSTGATWYHGPNSYRLGLVYERFALQGETYQQLSSWIAHWQRRIDPQRSVTTGVHRARSDYADTQALRDADSAGIGVQLRQALRGKFAPVVEVGASAAAEDNRRGHDDLARKVYGFSAGAGISPASQWDLGAALRLEEIRHNQTDQLLRLRREDQFSAWDFFARFAISRNVSVAGEFQLAENRSNIGLYNFRRHIAAFKLRYEFK
jgi:hypothetical protein